jgi:uncharacterized Fe-S center protein
MQESLRQGICTVKGGTVASLRILLKELKTPFTSGQKVGIKLHWGERGNHTFLPPDLAREIVR